MNFYARGLPSRTLEKEIQGKGETEKFMAEENPQKLENRFGVGVMVEINGNFEFYLLERYNDKLELLAGYMQWLEAARKGRINTPYPFEIVKGDGKRGKGMIMRDVIDDAHSLAVSMEGRAPN